MKSVNPALLPSGIIEILKNNTNKIKNLQGVVSTGGIIDAYESVLQANKKE